MPEADPLCADFARRFPDAFARTLARGRLADAIAVLSSLPAELRAAVIARLPPATVDQIIAAVPQFVPEWLAPAPLDAAVALLSRLPRETRLELVNALEDPAQRRQLLRHQQFPGHTIGSLVVDVPLRVVETARCSDVVTALRELEGHDPGQLIVISRDEKYVGVLDAWPLLTTRTSGNIRNLVVDLEPMQPEMSIDDVADDERWNLHAWLPVVDHENRVMGRVARSRVLRAAKAEAEALAGRRDLVGSLFAELVYLLGGVLERALRRSSTA